MFSVVGVPEESSYRGTLGCARTLTSASTSRACVEERASTPSLVSAMQRTIWTLREEIDFLVQTLYNTDIPLLGPTAAQAFCS